jgi:hypothetical protein
VEQRDDKLERQEVEAFLETRRELGPSYEREVVDAFAERIERAVDARVFHQAADLKRQRDDERGDRQRQLALGIVSIGASIPITIPLAVTGHELALGIAWAGIAAVNAAHASVVNARHRRNDRRGR